MISPSRSFKIRELSLGPILDDAIEIFRSHFALLLKITLVALVPWTLAMQLTSVVLQSGMDAGDVDAVVLNDLIFKFFPIVIPMLIVQQMIVVPLTTGAVIRAAQAAYLEQPVTLRSAWRRALRCGISLVVARGLWTGLAFIAPMIVVGVLMALLIGGIAAAGPGGLAALPIVMLLGFGLWLGLLIALTWLFFVNLPVIVIEDAGPVEAFSRSYRLMKPLFGTVFGLALVLLAINTGANIGGGLGVTPYLQAVLSSFAYAFVLILESCAATVCYYSARTRGEDYDLLLLAERVAEPLEDVLPPPFVSADS